MMTPEQAKEYNRLRLLFVDLGPLPEFDPVPTLDNYKACYKYWTRVTTLSEKLLEVCEEVEGATEHACPDCGEMCWCVPGFDDFGNRIKCGFKCGRHELSR